MLVCIVSKYMASVVLGISQFLGLEDTFRPLNLVICHKIRMGNHEFRLAPIFQQPILLTFQIVVSLYLLALLKYSQQGVIHLVVFDYGPQVKKMSFAPHKVAHGAPFQQLILTVLLTVTKHPPTRLITPSPFGMEICSLLICQREK